MFMKLIKHLTLSLDTIKVGILCTSFALVSVPQVQAISNSANDPGSSRNFRSAPSQPLQQRSAPRPVYNQPGPLNNLRVRPQFNVPGPQQSSNMYGVMGMQQAQMFNAQLQQQRFNYQLQQQQFDVMLQHRENEYQKLLTLARQLGGLKDQIEVLTWAMENFRDFVKQHRHRSQTASDVAELAQVLENFYNPQRRIEGEQQRRREAEEQQRREVAERQKLEHEARKKREAEEKRQRDFKRQQEIEAEQQRLEALRQQRIDEEKKRLAAQAERFRAEQQRQADEKEQKLEEKRRIEAERQKKQEEEFAKKKENQDKLEEKQQWIAAENFRRIRAEAQLLKLQEQQRAEAERKLVEAKKNRNKAEAYEAEVNRMMEAEQRRKATTHQNDSNRHQQNDEDDAEAALRREVEEYESKNYGKEVRDVEAELRREVEAYEAQQKQKAEAEEQRIKAEVEAIETAHIRAEVEAIEAQYRQKLEAEDKPLIPNPEDTLLLASAVGKMALKGVAQAAVYGAGKVFCFPGETPICVKDDSAMGYHSEPIASIQVGDAVASCNLELGEEGCECRQVQQVFKNTTDHLIQLFFDGKILKTTDEHPFYVVNKKDWVEARDLRIGDQLQNISGEIVLLEDISEEYGQFDVYNLDVQGNHNYYAADVLVHNCNEGAKVAAGAAANKVLRAEVGAAVDSGASSAARSVESRVVDSTGTVWDSIKATQPVYKGSVIPKSFELSASTGKFWVNGNATEHIAEYAVGRAVNGAPEAVRLASQVQLGSLKAAVEAATRQGVRFGEIIQVGGWELKFGVPRQVGQLPALIHALYR